MCKRNYTIGNKDLIGFEYNFEGFVIDMVEKYSLPNNIIPVTKKGQLLKGYSQKWLKTIETKKLLEKGDFNSLFEYSNE